MSQRPALFTRSPFEQKLCDVGANYLFRRSRGIVESGLALQDPQPRSKVLPECTSLEGRISDVRGYGAGLYYLRELPYVFTVSRLVDEKKGQERFATVTQFLASLPNGSPAQFIAMEASTFVTTSYTTTFENGMFVEYASDKPSEALATANVPIEVLSAIFSIPADLLTLRINLVTKEKDYANAEKPLLDSLKQLEQTRNASNGTASP